MKVYIFNRRPGWCNPVGGIRIIIRITLPQEMKEVYYSRNYSEGEELNLKLKLNDKINIMDHIYMSEGEGGGDYFIFKTLGAVDRDERCKFAGGCMSEQRRHCVIQG